MFAVRFIKGSMGVDGLRVEEEDEGLPVDMDEETARSIANDLSVFGYNVNATHEQAPGGVFIVTDREIAEPHAFQVSLTNGCIMQREAQALPEQAFANRKVARPRAPRRTGPIIDVEFTETSERALEAGEEGKDTVEG